MFFEMPRWEYAIAKGVDKDIKKSELYQLTKSEVRAKMYEMIRDGVYEIAPPHTALIPKDTPGEFRTVYVNEPADRVFLSIANDLLFELMPEMVHPRCTSYQKGIGCGKVVKEISKRICNTFGDVIGWKSDLSKYFDSVPIRYIDEAFDKVEEKHGHSAVIDVLRKYYHSDLYFNTDGELVESYQSLKQGCSVASWLADVVLFHIDEKLSSLDGEYVRYSDDAIFVGPDYKDAMRIMSEELAEMQMKLNPKKVEYLDHKHWFKFLGFSIKGKDISISSSRIKKFQKEIEARTIKKKDVSYKSALNSVLRFLYKGDGEHSWATQILPVCNVKSDIAELDKFVKDCLRAVITGKKKVGGLGFVKNKPFGCVERGKGQNVRTNREKTGGMLEGYVSIVCMQNAIKTRKALYETLVRNL